jgi:hypothetical protein
LVTTRRDVDGNERGNGGDYVFAGSPEKDFLCWARGCYRDKHLEHLRAARCSLEEQV